MNSNLPVEEITVQQLKQSLDKNFPPAILDVREPHELKIATLPATDDSAHIPLGQLQTRLTELDAFKERQLVVYCRSGGRSLAACNILKANGFKKVQNLKGGILAWSKEIDQSVPQY